MEEGTFLCYRALIVTKAPKMPHDVMRADCPARQTLDRIADKWTVLVILALAPKTLRFSALKAGIEGVSQKMLTQTVRHLERDGMILRKVYPTVPVTVEYSLTPLGHSLVEAVKALRKWSQLRTPEIEAARNRYDRQYPK